MRLLLVVNRNTGLARDLLRVAAVSLAALVLALSLNAVHPLGLPLSLNGVSRPGVPAWVLPWVQPIEPRQALEEAETNSNAVLVDVRNRADYNTCHARGAIALPYREFDQGFAAFRESVTPQRRVLVYCYGAECGLAVRVANRLIQAGYRDVAVVRGGFAAWWREKLPCEPPREESQDQ